MIFDEFADGKIVNELYFSRRVFFFGFVLGEGSVVRNKISQHHFGRSKMSSCIFGF